MQPSIRPQASHDLQSSRSGGFTLIFVKLRDLPSVDELARDVDDALAVATARTVLERAREEIRAGAGHRETCRERLVEALAAARRPRPAA